MKRFALVIGIILLALTLAAAGCTKQAPATTPATQTPAGPVQVTTEQGTLGPVNPGQSTVTVETPQGPKAVPITPNTFLTFEGKSCTLEELAQLEASGENFDCTVVYDEFGEVAALNVYRLPTPASVQGSISDVNIAESTVTVKTASGDKVFDVDPDTGLLIGGVACSLDLINALLDAGGQLPCTVIYDTDQQGNALYIDIANPPALTQGTGTIQSVDVQKSTVTIQTDKGPRTFEVDAKTGAFLNGEVCSLEDIQSIQEVGGNFAGCQVLFYTNEAGDLVYLDITTTSPTP